MCKFFKFSQAMENMYLYLPKVQEFYRDIFRPWEFSKLDIFLKVMNFCINGALYGFWLPKIRKKISRVKMRPRKKMNLLEEYLPLASGLPAQLSSDWSIWSVLNSGPYG